MVRGVPVPSSRVNWRSLSALGTLMQAVTVATRRSERQKVSKSTSGCCSAGFQFLSLFSSLMRSRRSVWALMASSSIFSKRSSGWAMVAPALTRSRPPIMSHDRSPRPSMRHRRSLMKGVKGSKATASDAHTCSAVLSTVAVRSGSVLNSFQGSVSWRYLLPARAMSMASLRASRKWKVSSAEAISVLRRSSSANTSRSGCWIWPGAGTVPPKYLWVRTTARLTKLPRMATSSLLLRVWKSRQVKSLSLVSGALAVRT